MFLQEGLVHVCLQGVGLAPLAAAATSAGRPAAGRLLPAFGWALAVLLLPGRVPGAPGAPALLLARRLGGYGLGGAPIADRGPICGARCLCLHSTACRGFMPVKSSGEACQQRLPASLIAPARRVGPPR